MSAALRASPFPGFEKALHLHATCKCGRVASSRGHVLHVIAHQGAKDPGEGLRKEARARPQPAQGSIAKACQEPVPFGGNMEVLLEKKYSFA